MCISCILFPHATKWGQAMPQSHTPRNQKEASAKASEPVVHWSERMLPMKEAFQVSGRSSSSYYRDVQIGRMPAPVPVGGSSRVVGWELSNAITKLIAERDAPEAA